MVQAASRPLFYCGGLGSIPGQYVRDLWWIKCHWVKFFYEYFNCPLSLSFHQYFILIFMYTLPLPEGRMGETWALPVNEELWLERYLQVLSCKGSNISNGDFNSKFRGFTETNMISEELKLKVLDCISSMSDRI